jgi:2-polyprenyl-6-methoxyphenol hydroxylase-like FAD-dependent oxidoreductase
MLYTYGITPLSAGLKPSEMKVKQLDAFVFLDQFKDFSGPWTEVAKAIREKGQVISSMSIATEAKRVTNGRIVLAGNTAHGLGPLLTRGQDIGMGVEDAYFLSQYLCLRSTLVSFTRLPVSGADHLTP